MAVVFVNPTWKRRFGLSRSAGSECARSTVAQGRLGPTTASSKSPRLRRFDPIRIARSLADKRNNPQLSHWTVGETDPPSPCLRRGEQFPVWLRAGEGVSFPDGEPRPSLDELRMTLAPGIVALGEFDSFVQRRMIVEPKLDEP